MKSMNRPPIYLDYNATTPIDPDVLKAMMPYLGTAVEKPFGNFGNPSSSLAYGKVSKSNARQWRPLWIPAFLQA